MMTAPNTILHLSSTSGPGGAEMIVSRIAASLDTNRFRSVVALYRPGWLKDRCEMDGLKTHVIPINGMFDWRWVRECCSLVRRENATLIHAHEFTGNTYGTLVAKLCRIPLVGTIHGRSYFCDQAKRRIAYRLVSRLSQLVVVSKDLRTFVATNLNIPETALELIYNGVAPLPPVSKEEQRRIRAELGIRPNEFVLGIVGSLYPVKRHVHLFQALPTIIKECPNTRLLVIGRGDLEVDLKEQAHRLGIDREVLFLGLRNDVPLLLSLLDVFVLPSLSEGLSMAILEAMAAGKPVVASKVGGNPELVAEGQTGYLVPPQDSVALADRVLKLLKAPDRVRQFGAAARERVSQHFSHERMIAQYQDLYERRLAGIARQR